MLYVVHVLYKCSANLTIMFFSCERIKENVFLLSYVERCTAWSASLIGEDIFLGEVSD